MTRLFLTIAVCLLAVAGTQFSSAETPHTNIVVIMADDMGYEAISGNGSESCRSPHVDRLAAEGVRFTNGFSNPICTPSRVKLMTGQYNVRNYVQFGKLDRGQTTFAHQVKAAGYRTCIAGKWQLGKELDAPQHFGFEQSCLWQHTRSGRSQGPNGERLDRRFVNPMIEINGEEKEYTNGEYGPQICADFICDFIDENKEQPFLVYFPMILTHCPFDPTPDSNDWDPKRMGSTTYKGDQNDPQRHFVDMVAYADKLVGQIDAQLEKSGVRENTLLIFTGDNGTDAPIVTPWNGTEIVGGKGSMTDTGTRVPFVASWPAGIKEPGSVVDDLVEFSDIMPTVCEAAGASLPDGHPTADGASILPVLKGDSAARKKDRIYIWYRGQVIVRNQTHALLAQQDGTKATLTRYSGSFDGQKLAEADLTDEERALKTDFEATLAEMAKTRLTGVSPEVREKVIKQEAKEKAKKQAKKEKEKKTKKAKE